MNAKEAAERIDAPVIKLMANKISTSKYQEQVIAIFQQAIDEAVREALTVAANRFTDESLTKTDQNKMFEGAAGEIISSWRCAEDECLVDLFIPIIRKVAGDYATDLKAELAVAVEIICALVREARLKESDSPSGEIDQLEALIDKFLAAHAKPEPPAHAKPDNNKNAGNPQGG